MPNHIAHLICLITWCSVREIMSYDVTALSSSSVRNSAMSGNISNPSSSCSSLRGDLENPIKGNKLARQGLHIDREQINESNHTWWMFPREQINWGKTHLGLADSYYYTLDGRIGMLGGCLACWIARSIPCSAETSPIYTMNEALRGTANEGGGWDQSIGSTVLDAIVHSWL